MNKFLNISVVFSTLLIVSTTAQSNEKLQLNMNASGSYKNITSIASGSYLQESKLEVGQNKISTTQTITDGDCGIVTVGSFPPKDSGFAGVKFRSIDDLNIRTKSRARKVSVGKQLMTFSLGSLFTGVVHDGKQGSIEIDVKADVKYYIAAKASQPKQSPYGGNIEWQPVIWQTKSLDCG